MTMSVYHTEEAARRAMEAVRACLACNASESLEAAYAVRMAEAALKTLVNARNVRARSAHSRPRPARLNELMDKAIQAAEGLLWDTKDVVAEIERNFIDTKDAATTQLAVACAAAGMTPNKARDIYFSTSDNNSMLTGDALVEAATEAAVKALIAVAANDETDDVDTECDEEEDTPSRRESAKRRCCSLSGCALVAPAEA